MGERATKAQSIQRTAQVFRWLLDGVDSEDICQLAHEEWGVAEETVRRYIHKARNDLKRLTEASKQENLRYALGHLTNLVRVTLEDKNYSCTLGAISQFSRITGLEKLVLELPRDELPELDETQALKEVEDMDAAIH